MLTDLLSLTVKPSTVLALSARNQFPIPLLVLWVYRIEIWSNAREKMWNSGLQVYGCKVNEYHRFYRLRNRDWKRCVSREWSVLRAKCILFDARLPGVRTKTLLLYRYRACGGCYSQIKVPDRRQWWCFTRSGLLQKGLAFGALPISDTRRQFNCKKLRTWARLSWS